MESKPDPREIVEIGPVPDIADDLYPDGVAKGQGRGCDGFAVSKKTVGGAVRKRGRQDHRKRRNSKTNGKEGLAQAACPPSAPMEQFGVLA